MAGSDVDSGKKKEGSGHSLKDLFSGGMLREKNKSLNDLESGASTSHRSFLKKRSSRTTISPQTSGSSSSSMQRRGGDKGGGQNKFFIDSKDDSSDTLDKVDQEFVAEGSGSNLSPTGTGRPGDAGVDSGAGSGGKQGKDGGTKGADGNHSTGKEDKHGQDKTRKDLLSHQGHGHGHSHGHGHGNGHGHLSLKRFLKRLKHTESLTSGKTKTKNHHHSILPKHSDSELYKKYGTVGRLLGAGASGSVSLVSKKDDPNSIFAIKKFRSKMPNESDHEYRVKVQNEYKIGEHLHHDNVIHTVELISEHTSGIGLGTEYYIIMEYCAYDFFNLVMSGLMSRAEACCYAKQVVDGVAYLHEQGLAHRDLKLDNCVVNDDGILKLIDFGSAVQFRKEPKSRSGSTHEIRGTQVSHGASDSHGEPNIIFARGVVGSDPYLAPEVLHPTTLGYDPRYVDVWSIGIIFCCMILRRFPWKIPKLSDPSFKSFAGIKDDDSEENLAMDMQKRLNVSSSSSTESLNAGSDRLLRLLPVKARNLIKNMLSIDINQRYLMPDVLKDDFYLTFESCHYEYGSDGSKQLVKGNDHIHNLVTEEDLQKISAEKERQKRLKDTGIA